MSFISVSFGYQQTKIFNINSQVAPLLDAMHTEAYIEMRKKLSDREGFFNKEIKSFEKDKAALEKRLEKLEQPPPEPKKEVVKRDRSKTKKTKKELEAEAEAEKKRLEEERI